MDEYHEEKFRKALAETNAALANLLGVCENMKKMLVKREFVVGKWYKPVASAPYGAKWVKCIGVDGEMGWFTQSNVHPAVRRNTSYVDWSVAPRDEHP